MSFTFDFILLFILIIIPGLIFKRFYFWGEFSKQFNTKYNIYQSLLYSVIPGILVQGVGLWLYGLYHDYEFNAINFLDVFNDILNKESKKFNDYTSNFLLKDIFVFIKHEAYVFALASGLGILMYLIVRNLRLDCRTKLFRFNNLWFYIFSGEIQRFGKFQSAKARFSLIGELSGRGIAYYPPHVDLLLDTNSGERIMYSGFVIDYDLNFENTNELDKIYLTRAHRYRKRKEGEEVPEEQLFGSRVKVPIEGDFFVVNANQIINMNIQFDYYETRFSKWNKKSRWLNRISNFGVFLYILIFVYFIFFNSLFENLFPFLHVLFDDFSFLSRLFVAFIFCQFVLLFLPTDKNLGEESESNENNEENQDVEAEELMEEMNLEMENAIQEEDNQQDIESIYEYTLPNFLIKVANLILYLFIFWWIYL